MKELIGNLFQKVKRDYAKLRELLIRRKINKLKGIELGDNVTFKGKPWISLVQGSRIYIDSNCTLVSDFHANIAGINHPCILSTIRPKSIIHIGKGSGMSGATIVAATSVVIGENVGLGVNSCIYDTDFHPVDPILRQGFYPEKAQSAPVTIGNDVWIGANVIILKGITIGDRSIIGAGSVVTHNVPPDCIFAGNPAKFIRHI